MSLSKQLPFHLGLPDPEERGTMICLSLMREQSWVNSHHFGGIFCLHFLPRNAGKWFLQNAGSTYLPNYTHGIGFKETVIHMHLPL